MWGADKKKALVPLALIKVYLLNIVALSDVSLRPPCKYVNTTWFWSQTITMGKILFVLTIVHSYEAHTSDVTNIRILLFYDIR